MQVNTILVLQFSFTKCKSKLNDLTNNRVALYTIDIVRIGLNQ